MIDDAGATEYDDARQVLLTEHTEHSTAGPFGAAGEALQLIHAVLSGVSSAGDTGREGATDGSDGAAEAEADAAQAAELVAALVVLRYLREEIAGWEPQLIAAARQGGVSWQRLAPALGVTSRQAAERRYLRIRPSTTHESTGEGRVRAARTRRAGDRAVAQWASQNSALLRQLAGQVGALDDVTTASALHHVDRVQQALADDDPTTLLSPLAEVHAHLKASHAVLAGQINTVTEHVEQLRRDTHDLRYQS